MIGKYPTTIGLKQFYPIYSVISKYTSCNTTTAAQQVDPENLLKLRKEKQGKQIEQLSQQQEKNKSHDNNILIVDDESDIAFTYKSMLNEEGYNVDAFTDPRQALVHFSQLDPLYYKLILLDIRMPNANGFQLYYKFKAMNPNVKILFVTALDVMGEELSSMLPGFSAQHDLIKKPLSNDSILIQQSRLYLYNLYGIDGKRFFFRYYYIIYIRSVLCYSFKTNNFLFLLWRMFALLYFC
jgi:CheY-like chemotaxis protein